MTTLRRQMKSGCTARDDSFFLHVGHFLALAAALSTPFTHSSQNTWPHVVDITCRPLAFTSAKESIQTGQSPRGAVSTRLPLLRGLFVVSCFDRGLTTLNGGGGRSSSDMLPSLTRYGDRRFSSALATDLVAGESERMTGLLSKFVKSTKL